MTFSCSQNFDVGIFMAACLVGVPSIALEVDDAHSTPDGFIVFQNSVLNVILNVPNDANKSVVTLAAAMQGATAV